MLPQLPRWEQVAKIAACGWRGLLRQRGVAGQEPWGASSQLTFVTSPCVRRRGPPEPEESKQKNTEPLKEWTLVVSPFGQLKVRLPCHVTVGPLDPHKYPNADRVFVTVSGQNTNPCHGADLDNVHVKYDTEQKEMAILSDDMDSRASVDVRVPVKFDLDIKTSGDGCVKIENIECESCRIETEKGTSILQSIKSKNIDIQAKGGKVISLGTLQGNADIHVSQESVMRDGTEMPKPIFETNEYRAVNPLGTLGHNLVCGKKDRARRLKAY